MRRGSLKRGLAVLAALAGVGTLLHLLVTTTSVWSGRDDRPWQWRINGFGEKFANNSVGAKATMEPVVATTMPRSQRVQAGREFMRKIRRDRMMPEDQFTKRRAKEKEGEAHPRFIKFEYSDPASYHGPLVEGWPPSKSRNLTRYVLPGRDNFLLRPPQSYFNASFRGAQQRLLIAVHSAPHFFESREGVRRSWGSLAAQARSAAAVVFVVGATASKATQRRLSEEASIFGDVLQADFQDHYNNLTLKSLHTLKFLVETRWGQGQRPDFIMKVDDDSYLNVPALWRAIKQQKKDTFIMGKSLMDKGKPVRPFKVPKTAIRRRFVLKWWCPSYMFSGKLYPRTLSGAGYLMTYSAAECIYRELLKLPFFHLEDVFVTGFGAQSCGVGAVDQPGFHPNPASTFAAGPDDVLLHYASAAAKSNLLKAFLFDGLQERYNRLLTEREKEGDSGDFDPLTVPPMGYFAEHDDLRGAKKTDSVLVRSDKIEKDEGLQKSGRVLRPWE